MLVAIWFGHMDVAIDINFVGDFHNNRALNHEMTAVLLAREDLTRATINLRNHVGRSPIISAIQDNSAACLILLPKVDLDMREAHQRSQLSSGESQFIVDQMLQCMTIYFGSMGADSFVPTKLLT